LTKRDADRADEAALVARLVTIVQETVWLSALLGLVKELGPSGAFVAAGAVRDTVWDVLTGRASTGPHADVDVVYWDATEREEGARTHEARLRAAKPDVEWEVTNQAYVHDWHWRARGQRVAPHRSVAEGLATWPETATAVGIRIGEGGGLDLLAPFGLEDLFELRLRHNPAQSGPEIFNQRVQTKRWLSRWPELRLVSASYR
jgi:uncharacterized protein